VSGVPSRDRPGIGEMAEAEHLVYGERSVDYDAGADVAASVRANYEAVAKVWSGLLSHKLVEDITAEEAALLMAAFKLSRQMKKRKPDNVVDAHGYLLLAACCAEGEQ
jgi:hypothetical protein